MEPSANTRIPETTPTTGTEPSYALDKEYSTRALVRRHGQAWVDANRVMLDNQWEQAVAMGLPLTDSQFIALRARGALKEGGVPM